MKPIRNNRYRRRRQRSGSKTGIWLGALLAAGILAAAVVCLLLFLPRQDEEPLPSRFGVNPASQASEDPSSAGSGASGEPAYQSLYPDLYVPVVEKIPGKEGDKVVYLTFDDGPSSQTEALLDVLDEQGVKATFFVVGQGKGEAQCKAWLKEIADRGHTIGVHSYSHDYQQIYASVEAFLEDFQQMHDWIVEATGQKPTIFRFAGGSVNDYNQENCRAIIEEMTRRGYTYFDWNVDSGDSTLGQGGEAIRETTVEGILQRDKSVVLLHNSSTKAETVAQVGEIIAACKREGYRFDVLDPSVKPFTFALPEQNGSV